MMQKIIYIAGKVTGLQDNGKRDFELVAERLANDGYIVLNPTILPLGLSEEAYMQISMQMLIASDEVYMLKNWKDSLGAIAEYRMAVKLKKKIFFQHVGAEPDILLFFDYEE